MQALNLAKAIVVIAVLWAGALLYPRPPADVSPKQVIAEALRANTENPSTAVDRIRRELREGCTPILEGSDTLSGRTAWPIRLKPPHRRYPWLEVWVDKESSKILAWKEWGTRDGHPIVLARFPRS
jgi:hypothetical protein